jgi:D-arabinose 1-dehydrogenase-like Zn-dependent alcohol dehydrogenase
VHRVAIRGSYVGTLDELREFIALGREGKVPPIPLDTARSKPR